MKYLAVIAFMLFGFLSHESLAKTPQQLKSDLASIMPSGKKARLVWSQGGTWSAYKDIDMHVYGVDSDDGVIRKITNGKLRVKNPHLTADGSRIIFTDEYSNKTYVINWDGTNQKEIAQNATVVTYWRNTTDNSDWAVLSKGYFSGTSPFVRLNVDNPATVVTLYDKNPTGEGSPLIGISQDGKRIACFFENGAGVINTDTKTATVSSYSGCGMGMAPDNSYDYFVHWGAGHHGIRIINGTQSKSTINLDSSILVWAHANNNANENNCHNNDEFQDAKWTNDRNYVTFSMFNTKANPFLVRISDKKWIHIYDDIGCGYTHGMDVCFYSGTTQQNSAPRITAIDTLKAMVGQSYQFTVTVTGNPLPTLTAVGLPTGLALVNGAIPSSTFNISGTPTQTGVSQVTLTAQNSSGTASESFVLVISTQNKAPVISAGKDTTINKGNAFRLSGTATDDGIPSPLTILWRVISGPANGAVVALVNELNSSVNFSVAGVFNFELSVSDGALTKKDTVMVTVNDAIPFVVNSPIEGAQIAQGSTVTIKWSMDPIEAVVVELSIDNGKTWQYLVSDSYYTTSYSWKVPSDITLSTNCFIRIARYHLRSDFARSGRFSIVPQDVNVINMSKRIPLHEEISYDYYSLMGKKITIKKMYDTNDKNKNKTGITIRKSKDSKASIEFYH